MEVGYGWSLRNRLAEIWPAPAGYTSFFMSGSVRILCIEWTTTWAKRRFRTFWCSVLPTGCLSLFGTGSMLITSRSQWRRILVWGAWWVLRGSRRHTGYDPEPRHAAAVLGGHGSSGIHDRGRGAGCEGEGSAGTAPAQRERGG